MKEQSRLPPAKIGGARKLAGRQDRIYRRGTLLFIEGEAGSGLFVIRSGKVRLFRQEGENAVVTEVCGPGSIIGEMSLLSREPRGVTAQVVEDTAVTVIDEDLYAATLQTIPHWLGGALQSLVKRLIETIRHAGEDLVRKCIAAVIKVLLLLGEQEGKKEGDGCSIPLQRAREELYACTGLSDAEIEKIFLHLILKRMLLIDKDDLDREYVVIRNTEVSCLYLDYLLAKRRGELFSGERLPLSAFDGIGFLLSAGESVSGGERDGAIRVTLSQIEEQWRRGGGNAPFDAAAFEQLAEEGYIEKNNDGSFVFHKAALSRLRVSGTWLPIFKEEVKL